MSQQLLRAQDQYLIEGRAHFRQQPDALAVGEAQHPKSNLQRLWTFLFENLLVLLNFEPAKLVRSYCGFVHMDRAQPQQGLRCLQWHLSHVTQCEPATLVGYHLSARLVLQHACPGRSFAPSALAQVIRIVLGCEEREAYSKRTNSLCNSKLCKLEGQPSTFLML